MSDDRKPKIKGLNVILFGSLLMFLARNPAAPEPGPGPAPGPNPPTPVIVIPENDLEPYVVRLAQGMAKFPEESKVFADLYLSMSNAYDGKSIPVVTVGDLREWNLEIGKLIKSGNPDLKPTGLGPVVDEAIFAGLGISRDASGQYPDVYIPEGKISPVLRELSQACEVAANARIQQP